MRISRDAVYLHLARIRKKFGLHSTIEICNLIDNNQQEVSSIVTFTPRGKEIFLLIIDGFTDSKIAAQLGICYNSVRRHREKMLMENNCNHMIELVAKYHNRKYI